jgi:Golgi nucleoside diphosphatase
MKFYNQKLTLASSLFVVLSGLSSQLWAGNYYAVVDAGSSGSRLYLYKKSTDAQGNPVAESLPLTGNKVKPGISVYVNQLAQVGDYIEPLLNTLDAELKSKGIPQSEVNFSLMATAGMRVESPNLQTAVYDEVKAKVKAMCPVSTSSTS